MEFQRKKYKEFAQKQLAGRWKPAVLAMLIVLIISIIFSIPGSNLSLSWEELTTLSTYSPTEIWNYLAGSGRLSPMQSIFRILNNLISFVMEIAICSFFLTYSRSPQEVPFKTFFEGFNQWGRGILGGLWQVLWYTIWGFAIALVILLGTVPLIFVSEAANNGAIDIILGISELITILGLLIIFIIKSIEYSHHILLLAEFPELGIRKALRISILITKGHRMDIFITALTFIPLILFSFITLGIGTLWTGPYIRMTNINIYHALLKDALETGKIHPEDLN